MPRTQDKPLILLTEGFSLASSLMAEVLQRELQEYEVVVMNSSLPGFETILGDVQLVIATKSVIVDDKRRGVLLSRIAAAEKAKPLVLFGDLPFAKLLDELAPHNLRGIFPDSTPPNVVIEGVRFILMGGEYFPRAKERSTGAEEQGRFVPGLASISGSRPAGLESDLAGAGHERLTALSGRELRVLECMTKGHSNKVIAHELSMAENTVKIHVKSILRKLHSGNRTEAVMIAQRLKLLNLQ